MESSKLRHILGQREALVNHLVEIKVATPEAGCPNRRTHMVQDGRSRRTSSKRLSNTAGRARREGNLLGSSSSRTSSSLPLLVRLSTVSSRGGRLDGGSPHGGTQVMRTQLHRVCKSKQNTS